MGRGGVKPILPDFNHRPMIIILRTNLNDIRDKMQVSKQTEITKLDIQVNKMDAEQRLGETHLTAGVTLHLLKGENAAERVRIVKVESYTMIMAPEK